MTTQTPTSSMATTRRGSIVLWVLPILIAGFVLTAASLPKFFGHETAVEMFDDIGFGDWFRYFCAGCELAGAVGLLIPRVAGLAASGLVAMMFGACCFLVFVLDTPQLVVTPIILAVPLTFIALKRLPDTDLSSRVAVVH